MVAGIDACQPHLHRQSLQRTVIHRLPVHIVQTGVLILRIILTDSELAHRTDKQEIHQLLGLATHLLGVLIQRLKAFRMVGFNRFCPDNQWFGTH